jgi:release factor glutamine methyltransferase
MEDDSLKLPAFLPLNLNENSTLKFYKVKGINMLKQNGIETYYIDSQILLAYITGLKNIEFFTKDDFILSKEMIDNFDIVFKKRINKCPVQYIVNKCEFMSLDFYVDKNVLIPRQDTEMLVETAIEYIKKNKYNDILEIGTGSGCISISLATYTNCNITAVDISNEALLIAKKNAINNKVGNKIDFIQSDLYESVEKYNYDLIISNPPYIKTEVINTLDEDVKNYEPLIALDGKVDGLHFYKLIIFESLNYLKYNGAILFEIGHDQGESVKELLYKDYSNIKIIKDLAGHDRVVVANRKYN